MVPSFRDKDKNLIGMDLIGDYIYPNNSMKIVMTSSTYYHIRKSGLSTYDPENDILYGVPFHIYNPLSTEYTDIRIINDSGNYGALIYFTTVFGSPQATVTEFKISEMPWEEPAPYAQFSFPKNMSLFGIFL